MTAIGENFDVLPSDNRDLRNSATQEVRALDQDVIALGVAVEVSGSGDGCKEQADLLLVQRERGLLGMEQRATRIGLRGTPVTAERLGSAAHRYRELMAAIRRLNVRGFMRPASTCSRSWDTQS